jgi:hypothetical protein
MSSKKERNVPSLVKRVAIVGVTAGALTLAASPAFAGGPPSHSDWSSKDHSSSSYSGKSSSDDHSKWSKDEHSKWSKDEHEKWSKDPSGGVETGAGGSATSISSFPAASAVAALGGIGLIGGGLITRRRRATSVA